MNCTRCGGSGFLNLHQIPGQDFTDIGYEPDFCVAVAIWIATHDDHDVSVCDCCGNGDGWYGDPGEHNPSDFGPTGPYAYNGGLPECS